jgi:hypothetical protein
LQTKPIPNDKIIDLLNSIFGAIAKPIDSSIRDSLVSLVADCSSRLGDDLLTPIGAWLQGSVSSVLYFESAVFLLISASEAVRRNSARWVDDCLSRFSDCLPSGCFQIENLTFPVDEALYIIHHLLKVCPISEAKLRPFIPLLFPALPTEFRLDLVARIAAADLLLLIPENYYTALTAYENSLDPDQAFIDLIPRMPGRAFRTVARPLEKFVISRRNGDVTSSYLRKCCSEGFVDLSHI